jgi:hypothetical protein
VNRNYIASGKVPVIVCVGEFLQILSKGRFRAAVHRVRHVGAMHREDERRGDGVYVSGNGDAADGANVTLHSSCPDAARVLALLVLFETLPHLPVVVKPPAPSSAGRFASAASSAAGTMPCWTSTTPLATAILAGRPQ